MGHQTESAAGERDREPTTVYERPRVERVLTPAELEREVLYAGLIADTPA
jgi:hypothetical protein